MVESDTMRVSAVVTDKKNLDHTCLAEDDIVLKNPPISVEVSEITCHLSCCLSNKWSALGFFFSHSPPDIFIYQHKVTGEVDRPC